MPVFSRRIEKLVWEHRGRGDDPWAVVGRLYQMLWQIREERDRLERQLAPQPSPADYWQRSTQARREAQEKRSVVYYVEREPGSLIKIGRSVQLQGRLQELRCGLPELNLLAVEPGGANIESKRHRQFAKLRKAGEWFEPGEKLLEHIAKLQPKENA